FGRLPVRFSPAARAGVLSVMVVSLGGGAAPVAAARCRVAGGLPALVWLGDRLRWQVVGEAGVGEPAAVAGRWGGGGHCGSFRLSAARAAAAPVVDIGRWWQTRPVGR